MIILNSEHDNLMTGRDETQQSNFNAYLLTDLTASRVPNREKPKVRVCRSMRAAKPCADTDGDEAGDCTQALDVVNHTGLPL